MNGIRRPCRTDECLTIGYKRYGLFVGGRDKLESESSLCGLWAVHPIGLGGAAIQSVNECN